MIAQQEILVDFEPDGVDLRAYYHSWNVVNVCRGPLGSGKTVTSCAKMLDAICDQAVGHDGVRRSRWCVVRNTANDLISTTMNDWFDLVPKDFGKFNGTAPMKHTLDFGLPDNTMVEAEVIFLPLDLDGAVKKLRGMQLTGIYFSEMKELLRSIVTMGISRTGRYPAQSSMPEIPEGDWKRDLYFDPKDPRSKRYWNGAIGDTNSCDDTHYLYALAEIEKPETWSFFHQPPGMIKDGDGKWIANPKADNYNNLHSTYYADATDGATDDYIKVNLANEYGMYVDGEPVHPSYSDNIHSADDFDYVDTLPVYIGMDTGRQPAAAIAQEVNGGYQQFDEFIASGISGVRFAPELKKYLQQTYGISKNIMVYIDPASATANGETSERSYMEIMRAHGFKCIPSPVSNQDTVRRRKSLDDPLGQIRLDGRPRYLVHKRCVFTRQGLGGKFYYRKLHVSYDEKFTMEPEKNVFSHVCEGVEYLMCGRGEGKIIQEGLTSKPSRRRGVPRR